MPYSTALGRWLNCMLGMPILQTRDFEYAEKSVFEWRPYGDFEGVWVASPLSLINGLIEKTGFIVITEQPDDVSVLDGWKTYIKRRKDTIYK